MILASPRDYQSQSSSLLNFFWHSHIEIDAKATTLQLMKINQRHLQTNNVRLSVSVKDNM
jgi:hypothetical protein